MMTSDYDKIDTLQKNYFHLDSTLLHPRGAGNHILNTLAFLGYLKDVTGKLLAGYPVTLTDIWSRVLAFRITNSSDLVVGKTFSGYASESKNIKNHMMPLPIIISSEQEFNTMGNFTTDNNIVILFNFRLLNAVR